MRFKVFVAVLEQSQLFKPIVNVFFDFCFDCGRNCFILDLMCLLMVLRRELGFFTLIIIFAFSIGSSDLLLYPHVYWHLTVISP
jgi:hypothetical protein